MDFLSKILHRIPSEGRGTAKCSPETSPVQQVQGSTIECKVDHVEEEHNQSGDSNDSLKENNQSIRTSNSQNQLNDSVLSSKSTSQQPLSSTKPTATRDPLTGTAASAQPQLVYQPNPTCNDSAFTLSSDDESFTDCPSFNSPVVNKGLQLGGQTAAGGGAVRQSLGMEALMNNMGKFTFDQSIAVNTTVDLVTADTTEELLKEEAEQVHEDTVNQSFPTEKEAIVDQSTVVDEEQWPDPPNAIDDLALDDVEMMSIVMENGPEDDYSQVALPDDVDDFPDSPSPNKEVNESPGTETCVENLSSATIPSAINESSSSYRMDVDVSQSVVEEEIEEISEPVVLETSLSSIKDQTVHTEEEVEAETSAPDIVQSTSLVVESPTKDPVSAPDSETVVAAGPDFKMPNMLRSSLSSQPQALRANPFDGMTTTQHENKQELFFSSKDFDFLLNKETANSLSTAIKDSVLLKFDPLINQPVSVEHRASLPTVVSKTAPIPSAADLEKNNSHQSKGNDPHQLRYSIDFNQASNNNSIAEERLEDSLLAVFGVARSQQSEKGNGGSSAVGGNGSELGGGANDDDDGQVNRNNCPISKLVDVTMSLVDVNNDSNLSVTGLTSEKEERGGENTIYNQNNNISSTTNISNNSTNLSNINFEDVEHSKLRMSVEGGHHNNNNTHNSSNGEVKIRNERYTDMDRKLKEMEEREEVLLKRLGEKEKQIAKMSHIVEEYERSIAGLLKDRAITKEEYEKRCLDLEQERNANYQHLSSLESTFSDLHVKYERSKQLMENLKKSEENLLADKRQSAEQTALQEQRYEKLKSHAMQQMDMANTRLRDESSQANQEISRLKALLKKEEITRSSLQEQLNQKTREIEELMKIWDELKTDA